MRFANANDFIATIVFILFIFVLVKSVLLNHNKSETKMVGVSYGNY